MSTNRFPSLFEVCVQHRDHRAKPTLSTFRVESDSRQGAITLLKRYLKTLPLECGGHPQNDYRRVKVLTSGPVKTITEAETVQREEGQQIALDSPATP